MAIFFLAKISILYIYIGFFYIYYILFFFLYIIYWVFFHFPEEKNHLTTKNTNAAQNFSGYLKPNYISNNSI